MVFTLSFFRFFYALQKQNSEQNCSYLNLVMIRNCVLLKEPLLVLLALIVAVDDLQEEAGQCDQLGVWSGKEAFQEAVTGLVEQNEDSQRIFHLGQNSDQRSEK